MKAQAWLFGIALLALGFAHAADGGGLSIADYDSVQAAIDANPGTLVFVPPGRHTVDERIRITTDYTGLYGPGTIVQEDPGEPVIHIENATGVQLQSITLTRAEGKQESTESGVRIEDAESVTIKGVRVIENKSRQGAIEARDCKYLTVRDCEIIDYKRIAIDDRTEPGSIYGYAFHAIDGTGLVVRDSMGSMIQNNRIIERELYPTPELKEKYSLGQLTEGKHPSVQGRLAEAAFRDGYVSNWHQGSALIVTGPANSHQTIVSGNYIENSAQGIDLHCDNAVITNNVVNHGMMGVKATHGSRNILIANNMLSHIDLWGVLLNPGSGSFPAEAATEDREAREANIDGGTIIANNIITDYGYGHEYWNYGGAEEDMAHSFAIALFEGQFDENPPLTDVLIEGNIVYDTGKDKKLVDGEPTVDGPRYLYAVYIGPWEVGSEPGPSLPRKVKFDGNIFHPGVKGVCNIEIDN